MMASSPDGWQAVLFYSTLTAVTTGLGALPLLSTSSVAPRRVAYCHSAAAGMCLAASVSLAMEGFTDSASRLALGLLAGYLFIVGTREFLERHEHLKYDRGAADSAQKTLLLLVVMTAHSFAEGVGIGVSFKEREVFGACVSIAIAIHNIPEGLAIALVLVPRGTSVTRAAAWAILSSLPQPLMAVPAFAFVHTFDWLLPIGLGFAASAMAHVTWFELIKDARLEMKEAKGKDSEVWTALGFAFTVMLLAQRALHAAAG
mmetsp:Transcript_3402/g.11293  ORF Transcript_3402/g.11293 Transcript_3402/m.11293 type:complete len:259 (-) Transcript_3402:467-1243(-)